MSNEEIVINLICERIKAILNRINEINDQLKEINEKEGMNQNSSKKRLSRNEQ